MADFSISIRGVGKDGLTRKLRRWDKTQPKNLARGLNRAGIFMQRAMRLKIKSQLGKARGGVNRRTGRFQQSIKWHVGRVGTKRPFLKVGSDAVQARIREKGGVIRAKRVEFLTIPFRGVTGDARDFQNTFVITTASGFKFIAQRKGKGFKPLFALKKSVQHPKQPWFKPTVARNLRKMLRKIQTELNKTLKR